LRTFQEFATSVASDCTVFYDERILFMTFASSAVKLEWNQNNMILKRGQTVIMIDAEKVQNLRVLSDEQAFFDYWRTAALQNREARRVFEAWERKDSELIQKIKQEVLS
jgi:hypothetical protein